MTVTLQGKHNRGKVNFQEQIFYDIYRMLLTNIAFSKPCFNEIMLIISLHAFTNDNNIWCLTLLDTWCGCHIIIKLNRLLLPIHFKIQLLPDYFA